MLRKRTYVIHYTHLCATNIRVKPVARRLKVRSQITSTRVNTKSSRMFVLRKHRAEQITDNCRLTIENISSNVNTQSLRAILMRKIRRSWRHLRAQTPTRVQFMKRIPIRATKLQLVWIVNRGFAERKIQNSNYDCVCVSNGLKVGYFLLFSFFIMAFSP